MTAHSDFFAGKRPWSIIKDEVLRQYMPGYLAKVSKVGKRIRLIDGYAGAGVYDDGTAGSPLIMCSFAEKFAKGKYEALFVNKDRRHHEKLSSVLAEHVRRDGWSKSARALRGDARAVLASVPSTLGDDTLFLYLDPFGPTGSEFSLLEPFLTRKHSLASTEILLTMSMPAMHRFAESRKVREGRWSNKLDTANHAKLDRILNGDYWKEILWRDDISSEEREWDLIKAYATQIEKHLKVVRYCPVREGPGSRIKYFIVFASRHIDALVLMNDGMTTAYFKYMHERLNRGGLFESIDWREFRDANGFVNQLDDVIVDAAARWPNLTRKELWTKIVDHHFGLYVHSEYTNAVSRLARKGRILCPPDPTTRRLNDMCRITLPSQVGS